MKAKFCVVVNEEGIPPLVTKRSLGQILNREDSPHTKNTKVIIYHSKICISNHGSISN
jgi:hypothetical protein